MAQKLIVEGKDAIVLSAIMDARGLPKPLGYTNRIDYAKHFVVNADGVDKALRIFEQELDNTDNLNIGLIIDADTVGVQSRWEAVLYRLKKVFSDEELQGKHIGEAGVVIANDSRKVGTWIMPNNADQGYLEHFVTGLITDDSGLWEYTRQVVAELSTKPFCRFVEVKKQKVLAHTWLAWQANSGLPFGSAVQAGFLDAKAAIATPFMAWFEQTFQLSD